MTADPFAAVLDLSAADATFEATGMELLAAADGSASVALVIRPDMTNGSGIAHGGWVFLLADTAFGYAATTRMPGALTTDAEIRFHRPARRGERIVAEAATVEATGKSVLIDVTVTNPAGERIASFRAGGRAPGRPALLA